ncbi:MAG: metallophosphatase, partial [Proteobacteria bacterium]|nr:metallophosphatase [Pseudomonadota bacterium]
IFSFVLLPSGAISLGGAASVSGGAGGGFGQGRTRWLAGDILATTQKISFVHVADVHAHYNPVSGGSSPVARLRGYFEQVRRENPYTILTNAGDDYEKGSIAEEISHGAATREIVKAMQYDVRTIGNHDFAWGIDELMAFSRDPSAIVLASNTKMTAGNAGGQSGRQPGWTDYAVLRVGQVKIGFFALVSKPWNEKDEQYDGDFYPGMPELRSDFNFVDIARDIIAQHRGEVDLLVLVSHLGVEEDARLARETQGIDLILGGHTHAVMSEPLRVKDTAIVHAGANAENIGRFDIEYDLQKRCIRHSAFSLIPNREGETPVDEATDREVRKILHDYQGALSEGFTRLSADQSSGEMAMLAARAAVEILEVDAAFVGLHAVRKEWRRGNLTRQDVFDAFPVEREPAGTPGFTSLYRLQVTGEDLARVKAAMPESAYWGPQRRSRRMCIPSPCRKRRRSTSGNISAAGLDCLLRSQPGNYGMFWCGLQVSATLTGLPSMPVARQGKAIGVRLHMRGAGEGCLGGLSCINGGNFQPIFSNQINPACGSRCRERFRCTCLPRPAFS